MSYKSKTLDGQALITYNRERKEIYVAFRGTINKDNWIYTNFNMVKDDFGCNKCKVHNGFENLYGKL